MPFKKKTLTRWYKSNSSKFETSVYSLYKTCNVYKILISFKKLKMIFEETSLNNTFSKCIYWSTFLWFQSDLNPQKTKAKKANYVPNKGVHHRRHTKLAPLPSTRISELHASDQYVNEKELFLLVWLNKEVEGVSQFWLNLYNCNLFLGYSPQVM